LQERGLASNSDLFFQASLLMHFRGLARKPGFYRSALDVLQILVEREPDNAHGWLAIGEYWMDEQAPGKRWLQQAIEAFSRAASLKPAWSDAHYGLGMLHQALGHTAEATQAYLSTLSLDPEHAAAHFRIRSSQSWSQLTEADRQRLDAARRPAPEPEQITVTDPADLRAVNASLDRHGCALIRNALPTQALQKFKSRFQPTLTQHAARAQQPMFLMRDVHARMAIEWADLARQTALQNLVCSYCASHNPGWTVTAHQAWHIQLRDGNDVQPTMTHQDFPVLGQQASFLTCWTPLDPCGRGEAPGVRLFLEHFRHPVHSVEHRPDAVNAVSFDQIREHLRGRAVTPGFDPGDLMLLGPCIFHETQVVPGAPGQRISCDVRFRAGPTLRGFDARFAREMPLSLPPILSRGPLQEHTEEIWYRAREEAPAPEGNTA